MRKIGVLIVEDSEVIRQLLLHIIGGDSRFEILATVASAEDAIRILQKVSPDVISLDIRLPGMNGLEATRQIMRDKPTPIVVCSASVESDELKITIIMVAHDIPLVMNLCDHIQVLNYGRLIAEGDPAAVRSFVAAHAGQLSPLSKREALKNV